MRNVRGSNTQCEGQWVQGEREDVQDGEFIRMAGEMSTTTVA